MEGNLGAVGPEAWERLDVSDWVLADIEAHGSEGGYWLREPRTDGFEGMWLHKDRARHFQGGEEVEQGSDWAEVVSTRIGELLRVPCARTRFSVRNNCLGSISQQVSVEGYGFYEGTVILASSKVPGYFPHSEGAPAHDPDRPDVERPGHTLQNIKLALGGFLPPPGFEPVGALLDAFDVFTGYLLFDALVANQDRHEQNWGVLWPLTMAAQPRLAASFDHGNSLGFNLTDENRSTNLESSQRLERWARNGRAKRFEHVKKAPTLLDVAVDALQLCSQEGAHWWCERLAGLDMEPVLSALDSRAVPGMSDLAATFASQMLTLNLRRLRDATQSSLR